MALILNIRFHCFGTLPITSNKEILLVHRMRACLLELRFLALSEIRSSFADLGSVRQTGGQPTGKIPCEDSSAEIRLGHISRVCLKVAS